METEQYATKIQQVNDEIKEEIRKYLEKMKMQTQHFKIYGIQQSSSKKEVYSNTVLSQERRKIRGKRNGNILYMYN